MVCLSSCPGVSQLCVIPWPSDRLSIEPHELRANPHADPPANPHADRSRHRRAVALPLLRDAGRPGLRSLPGLQGAARSAQPAGDAERHGALVHPRWGAALPPRLQLRDPPRPDSPRSHRAEHRSSWTHDRPVLAAGPACPWHRAPLRALPRLRSWRRPRCRQLSPLPGQLRHAAGSAGPRPGAGAPASGPATQPARSPACRQPAPG